MARDSAPASPKETNQHSVGLRLDAAAAAVLERFVNGLAAVWTIHLFSPHRHDVEVLCRVLGDADGLLVWLAQLTCVRRFQVSRRSLTVIAARRSANIS